MQLHELKPAHKNKEKKRIGRGVTRGKTSGRGHKGQKARAGAKIRPAMRDVIKRIPKKRGHGIGRSQAVNTDKEKSAEVNVGELEAKFENKEEITPQALVQKGLVNKRGGRIPSVKILGNGDVSKSFNVSGCMLSSSAEEKIKQAGGGIE